MKKLFTLTALLLCAVVSSWGVDYYTPTADEIIILNNVYDASKADAGYSKHAAVAWAGTASTNSKKAGDPNNEGNATSSNVACYSVKGNGKGKNITINITGVSKITIYHESHSSRYVELRSESKSGTLIGKADKNTYFTEVDLNGTSDYSIFLHGTAGSDDQDFNVYAIKLTKYVARAVAKEAFAGVKNGTTVLTEGESTAGYSVSGNTITLTDVAYVKPTTVKLVNHTTYTDKFEEDINVDITFGATASEGFWTGTATIGETEYTVKVPYEKQEVTGITINGSAISAEDLATLTSTKSVSIDGSTLNGIGMMEVTLSGGETTVTRTFNGNDVVYKFTINGNEEYNVTFTNIRKTYTAEGSIVYFKKGDTEVEGANTKTITANGITFGMVADKTFQYGSAKVTIGGNEYTPLKLSTGSAVNVTFPEYKVATKVKIYGWSADGNGSIYNINETSTAEKSIDTSGDIFYATNTSNDIYPSVYEYTLDNWESFYFNPGGSASQPFVIMDFVLADTRTALSSFAFNGGVTSVIDTDKASFVAPTLEATAGGSDVLSSLAANITYSSSNTDVATVNASTGEVALSGTVGNATITATFAGDATYANTEASYTITVTKNPVGNHSLTWTLSPLNTKAQELTSSQESTSTLITNLTTIDISKVGFASSPSKAEYRTAKINRTEGKDADKYIYVTFKVADGYTFTPSSIEAKVANVSNPTTFDAELVDAKDVTVSEKGKSFESTGGEVETWIISNDDESKKMTGTVTLKIYAYAESAGSFRFGETITIAGEVARETVTIPVSAAGYATFYTDKALDFKDIEDITAYTATKAGNTVTFNKVTDAVRANEGLLLKADEGTYTIPVATTEPAAIDNVLEGVTSATEKTAGIFVLMDGAQGVGFYKTTAAFTVGANTAYLPADVVAGARMFIGFDEEGEATGIEAIERSQMKDNFFNLNGQRVAAPQKGLYIVNGKKVILK